MSLNVSVYVYVYVCVCKCKCKKKGNPTPKDYASIAGASLRGHPLESAQSRHALYSSYRMLVFLP